MHTSDNGPKVVELSSFRPQPVQQPNAPAQQEIPEGFTPTLMWYPVWVLVPTQTPPNTP